MPTNESGNATRLREVLETCLCLFETIPHVLVGTTVRERVEAALAEPPRNCDMGTAEEQKCRFLAVCEDKKHYDNVRKCPLFVGPNCYPVDCFARWGQMPYGQEGGDNGSK